MDTNSEKKFEYLFRLELRGQTIPESNQGKVQILEKRKKKVQRLMYLNVFFIIIILSSSYYGYTSLGKNWLIALIAVFGLNMALQFKQMSQVKEAISFYSKNE